MAVVKQTRVENVDFTYDDAGVVTMVHIHRIIDLYDDVDDRVLSSYRDTKDVAPSAQASSRAFGAFGAAVRTESER